jgi:hypothetical protein
MEFETFNQQRTEKMKERARVLDFMIILMIIFAGLAGACAVYDELKVGIVEAVSLALFTILLIGLMVVVRKRFIDRNLKPLNTEVSRSDSK